MAITSKEIRALEPGDVVRVISVEDYLSRRALKPFSYNWGSSMTEYCGRELTVKSVNPLGSLPDHIYVDENNYYWLPEFIDCIIYSSSKIETPSEDNLMDLLFS